MAFDELRLTASERHYLANAEARISEQRHLKTSIQALVDGWLRFVYDDFDRMPGHFEEFALAVWQREELERELISHTPRRLRLKIHRLLKDPDAQYRRGTRPVKRGWFGGDVESWWWYRCPEAWAWYRDHRVDEPTADSPGTQTK
jgi:hypothetical protein